MNYKKKEAAFSRTKLNQLLSFDLGPGIISRISFKKLINLFFKIHSFCKEPYTLIQKNKFLIMRGFTLMTQ